MAKQALIEAKLQQTLVETKLQGWTALGQYFSRIYSKDAGELSRYRTVECKEALARPPHNDGWRSK